MSSSSSPSQDPPTTLWQVYPRATRILLVLRKLDPPYQLTILRDVQSLQVFYRHTYCLDPVRLTRHDYFLGPGYQPLWVITPSKAVSSPLFLPDSTSPSPATPLTSVTTTTVTAAAGGVGGVGGGRGAGTENVEILLQSPQFGTFSTLAPDQETLLAGNFPLTPFRFQFSHNHRDFRWKKPAFSRSLKCELLGAPRQVVMSLDVNEAALSLARRFLVPGEELLGILHYPANGLLHDNWSEELESLLVTTALLVMEYARGERDLSAFIASGRRGRRRS